MSSIFLIIFGFLIIFQSLSAQEIFNRNLGDDFSFLSEFTCAVAKDLLEKNSDMKTIALIELENGFPKTFSRKILKCLPHEVSKVVMMAHSNIFDDKRIMTKGSMVIFVADNLNDVSLKYLKNKRNNN